MRLAVLLRHYGFKGVKSFDCQNVQRKTIREKSLKGKESLILHHLFYIYWMWMTTDLLKRFGCFL